MHSNVYWVFELEIAPGREADVKALMSEMVGTTQAEPETLGYQWSMDADGRRVHIYERYADSAATMTHLGTFRDTFLARFMDVLKPARLVVYGSPNADVKNALSALNPVFMDPVGGFIRA